MSSEQDERALRWKEKIKEVCETRQKHTRPAAIEFYLVDYAVRCRSREEWVPFSDVLLDAADEITKLREKVRVLERFLREA